MTRVKTDCFAYRPGRQNPRRKAECAALDKLYCRDGECSFYKDRRDMSGYPKDEYDDTQNMSTGQQNEAPYIKSEYGTHKSSAAELIRAQGEQIRYMSADEYLKSKIGGDADGRIQSSRISGACSRSGGAGGKGL